MMNHQQQMGTSPSVNGFLHWKLECILEFYVCSVNGFLHPKLEWILEFYVGLYFYVCMRYTYVAVYLRCYNVGYFKMFVSEKLDVINLQCFFMFCNAFENGLNFKNELNFKKWVEF
jgi:hypothetical protein